MRIALFHLYNMGVSVAAGQLNDAQTIAMRIQAHGLSVNRDNRAKISDRRASRSYR